MLSPQIRSVYINQTYIKSGVQDDLPPALAPRCEDLMLFLPYYAMWDSSLPQLPTLCDTEIFSTEDSTDCITNRPGSVCVEEVAESDIWNTPRQRI